MMTVTARNSTIALCEAWMGGSERRAGSGVGTGRSNEVRSAGMRGVSRPKSTRRPPG